MRDFHETIRSLYRATIVGDLQWTVKDGSFFVWVGGDCYSLKRESFIGLRIRDTLWHHSTEHRDWQLMGASDHGVLASFDPSRPGQQTTASGEVTMLFEAVKGRARGKTK